MDYAAYFTRYDEFWALTFPDVPQSWAIASSCNELLATAELELGLALCRFYAANMKLPHPTAESAVRVRPNWWLMKRFELVDALTERLLFDGDQLWRTLGLGEFVGDGGPCGRYDAFLLAFEWSDEEVIKTLAQLGVATSPEPHPLFQPRSFESSAGFNPGAVLLWLRSDSFHGTRESQGPERSRPQHS